VRSEDPLALLITEYSKSEPISVKGINFVNEYFDATFIYNYSGRADRYKRKFDDLGIKNCITSIPNIPTECPVNHRIIYYLKDIIKTAKTYNYKRINIIGDVLLIHQALGNTFYYLQDQIRSVDWHILQYCSIDHKYHDKSSLPLNWQFYLDTNPDLAFTTESDTISHWESVGEIQGRIPGPSVQSTDSNNTLAFAIKSEVYDLLEGNLNLILNARPEVAGSMPIFDFRENARHKAMTVPNLFVQTKTGKTIARSLRWHLPNYAF
jgi:hypothetical protein